MDTQLFRCSTVCKCIRGILKLSFDYTCLCTSIYRWKSFKRQMLSMRAHSDSKGFELKRPNDSIYSFPCPNCMCRVNRTEESRPAPVI